jgi:hypothetical protein
MIETPQDILDAVPTYSEVERMTGFIFLDPDREGTSFRIKPESGDGITDENKIA